MAASMKYGLRMAPAMTRSTGREQGFQRLFEGEIVIEELLLCRGPEIDDEVDVAVLRVEMFARRRPENVQAPDAMLPAQSSHIVATGIDEFCHGHEASIIGE